MIVSKVIDNFVIFTKLTHEQALEHLMFCEIGMQRVAGMIRESTDTESNQERLCLAAAAVAYCAYTMAQCAQEIRSTSGSFRLGELTIQESGEVQDRVSKAKAVQDEMLSYLEDLLRPQEALFEVM